MGWWKADPVPEVPNKDSTASTGPLQPQLKAPPKDDAASACPVDEKTRQVWLNQAKQLSQSQSSPQLPQDHPRIPTSSLSSSSSSSPAIKTFAQAPSEQCSSDRIDQTVVTEGSSTSRGRGRRPLSSDREVSSIPRAYPFAQAAPSTTTPKIPSNAEAETGHDQPSGNWIYPSESQFFSAVMRKHPESASPTDLASSISSIIPIHNAVNERAWSMIRKWEAGEAANKTCGGPKLLRFEGKGAGAKSPRAVMKSWSGYQEPFDRHDWTVQRCDGTEVEYVIDFYQGRSPAGQVTGASQGAPASGMGGINFYLDVRPKLNSFQGCKMRLEHFVGWR